MDVFTFMPDVAQTQVELCLKDPDAYVRTLVTSGATRWILVQLYITAIRTKKLPVLESLPREIKVKYWEAAKKEAAGHLTNENLQTLCKALYVLDHLLKPYIHDGSDEQQAG